MDFNWLTPKAQARPAGEKGWGSFLIEPVAKGETVAAFGGWMVAREVLSTMSHDRQGRSIQVDEDLYLVSSDTPEPGDMLNHSCDPNCCLQSGLPLPEVRGWAILQAIKELKKGDEVIDSCVHNSYVVDSKHVWCL